LKSWQKKLRKKCYRILRINRVSKLKPIIKIKKIFVLLLVIVCVGTVFGQSQKQNVAVYITGEVDAGDKKVIGSKLVSAIATDRRYTAVERTTEFLAAIGKEQDYQHSGEVDDRQIAAIGKKFGVNYVCVVEVSVVRGATHVEARLINVVTAAVSITANELRVVEDINDLVMLAENLAYKLTAATEDADQMQNSGALTAQKTDISASATYDEAVAQCAENRTGGYSDWRLPSIAEFKQFKRDGTDFGGTRHWVTGSRNGCMSSTSTDIYECKQAAVRCVRSNQ
jgi:hypothetical protein